MTATTHNPTLTDRITLRPARTETGGTRLARIVSILQLWRERSIQRRHLSALTARELDDIGIGAEAAAAEAAKAFWQA